jgi:hypothetical protein
VFYYLRGNQIKVFHVAERSAAVLYTFSEYSPYTYKGAPGVRALGEEDLSENGRLWALAGEKPDGSLEIFVFDLLNGVKGPVLGVQDSPFDNLYVTPREMSPSPGGRMGTAAFAVKSCSRKTCSLSASLQGRWVIKMWAGTSKAGNAWCGPMPRILRSRVARRARQRAWRRSCWRMRRKRACWG